MPSITVELTDTQLKGLQYVANDPQEWSEHAITERCRKATDEIVKLYTDRALDEGVQIPTTREAIITDAFARGWVQTAADRVASSSSSSD